MKVLFDQGTPVPLRQYLDQHTVDTAFECGWSQLRNGELLDAAETGGYQLLITTDQNLRYQQQLSTRSIAVLVLQSTSWPRIKLRTQEISAAVDEMGPGQYREIPI